jgi:GAF domain-containing protein
MPTKPRIPDNEEERLASLQSYGLLDTSEEEIFDNITWIAALVCNVPQSSITLIDRDRQWFKSAEGMKGKEDPRDISFCAFAINEPDLMEVTDATKDERFFDNPLVLNDPSIRFYAGIPLINSENYALGTLCVLDKRPNKLTALQKDILRRLSQIVIALFEARKLQANQIKEHEQSELIHRA